MELFYTLTSPYSRKILLAADHLGLTNDITMTFMHPIEDKTGKLRAANPLERIPTLMLNNGDIIFDSPLIADVLCHLAGAAPFSFEERLKQQKIQSLADGIMDAAVSSQMEKTRIEAEQSAYWLERWHKAILRAVAAFESSMIDDTKEWHIGSMGMACALDYLRFRHPDITWMEANRKTHEWYQAVIKKDIMVKTDPR